MKKELFAIGMGSITAIPIAVLIHTTTLYSFFFGMVFSAFWLKIAENVIWYNNKDIKNPVINCR